MPRQKRVNANNEDLIGLHYRQPGTMFTRVVVDIDTDTEGLLHVAIAATGATDTAHAFEVRPHLIGAS